MTTDQSYILFGAGSPLIVDYEEAVRSRNAELAAIVINHDSPSLALDQASLIDKSELAVGMMSNSHFLVPLFTPGHRSRAVAEIVELSQSFGVRVKFGRLVHQSAIVAESTKFGEGVFLNSGVTIGGAADIGAHCIINRTASIGHHVSTAPYVSIGPGAILAGQISVGPGTLIGAGAVIHPGVTIGANSVVAAGSVVSAKQVPDNTIISGHPAKPTGRPILGYGGTSVPVENG